jgi:tRNA U34 5-carboxymethylaminomethyl modifying GTPase MnmE/TrmE
VNAEGYPWALRQRLGEGAASALADVLAAERKETVTLVMDRFDTRLEQEFGRLREELSDQLSTFRAEVHSDFKELRSDVKVEVAVVRADLITWSFLFWVTQLAAVGGLMTLLR